MNKTFKIVFNKARGALMVANEVTSSVQKKGVRTVVAMAAVAACGAVVAADAPDLSISNGTFSFSKNTTVTTTVDDAGEYAFTNAGEYDDKKLLAHFSGIAATKGETTVTVADGATLTITGTLEEIDGADRIYLVTAMNGSSVTTDGHISGKLSTSGKASIRGIRADGGSTIEINSNLDADITSSNVETEGVEAYGGSHISFNGDETTLTATTSGSVYFIKNLENSTIEFNSSKTTITVDNSAETNTVTKGFYSYYSKTTTNFEGNTSLTFIGNTGLTYGINVECDPKLDTFVNFNGDQTTLTTSGKGFVVGVYASGVAGEVNFAKTATVEAESESSDAVGVMSQYGARVNFKGDATITSKTSSTRDDESTAYGLWLTNYSGSAGNASFGKSLTITSTSKNFDAYGIFNNANASNDSYSPSTFGGELSVAGAIDINATAGGDAIGIWAIGSLANVTINNGGNISAKTTSNGTAYGILAMEGATVNLGASDKKLTITATNGVGIEVNDAATVTLNGATIINADTALTGNGTLTANGNLTLNGTVSNFSGTTNIKGGTTNLTDKTGYFGGNVVVSDKGSLTASGFTLKDDQKLEVNAGGTLTSTVGTVFYEKNTTTNASLTMEGTEVELKKGFSFAETDSTLVLTDPGTYKLALFNSMLSTSNVGTLALVNATVDLNGADSVDINGSNVILPEIQSDVPVTVTGKSLTIDASSSASAETSKVGSLKLNNADSGLTVTNNSDVQIESLENVGGTISVDNNATLKVDELKVSGEKPSVNITGDSTLNVETLTGENATISIGTVDGTAGATMKVGKLALTSGTIFVDPDQLYNAHATLTIDEVADNKLLVNVIAGNGSLVTIGASDSIASSAVDKLGFSNRSAIVYTAQSLDLTNGSINIGSNLDASKSAGEGNVKVNNGGALIVDQSAIGSSTVFSNATVTFSGDGKLGLANAIAGTLTLGKSLTGLKLANVYTDTPFIEVASVTDTGVTTKVSATGGLGALASTGMQAMTRRADSVLAQTIADRTSVDQDYAAGTSLWVDVTGERYQADKMDNNASFKSDMGYGAFGGDFAITEDISAGAAIQYGKGTVRSSVSSIKNSIDSYGITAYGSMKFGDAKVVAEASYIKNENDITSSQTALNQSVDTDIYSLGIRGQHRFTAGQFQFVPSVGVRVSRLNTDAMKLGAVNIKKQEQTLVQVPIALRVNGFEQNAGGWSVAPSFKIAYVPTFGDKEISVLGADQTVIDTSPVQGDFGIRAQKGNLMVNANFMVGGGKDGTSSVGGKAGLKYVF